MKKSAFLAIAGVFVLSGCFGPSQTLARYSEAEIQRCARSLTFKEQQAAQVKARNTAMIPFAGIFMAEEALYKEYERVCRRKGIIR